MGRRDRRDSPARVRPACGRRPRAGPLGAQGVAEWSGQDSLPLWIADPEWNAFLDRSNAAARAAGLRLRPLDDLLSEVLEWELAQGLDRPRGAGLSAEHERELLAALRG